MSSHKPIGWRFDPSPPSGSRSGGNAAEYAFNPSINHFVREVIQNVLDNKSSSFSSVQVGFTLITLKGSELNSFLKTLQFDDLQNHLKAAASQPNGTSIRLALEELENQKHLLLMAIEDSQTTGLLGDETGADSNFAALCRHELYSNKETNTAGGSYGLGKAVLWSFSGLSTVLFNSVLETHTNGRQSPRFIGRTELPWHAVDGEEFSGPGWFGEVKEKKGVEHAESLWSPISDKLVSDFHIGRTNGYSGTSILIVGFRSPAQEDISPKEFADEFISAVKSNYWPSIAQKKLKVTVSVKNSPTQPSSYEQHIDESDISSSFLDCWNIYSQNKSDLKHELRNPGDVVEVPIEVTIPSKIDNSEPEIPASASLVIRLAEEDEEDKNTVAYFRGPGMVVDSYQLNRLSLTQRPFHAIVVCGEARTPIIESDRKLDSFLRAAEPPSHNEWTVTKKLKEIYRPGYKKLLDELTRKVKESIRKSVSEKTPTGTEGPQLLKKLFPLHEIGSQQPTKPKPFRVSNQLAELEKDVWKFSGTVNVNSHYSKAEKNWRGVIDLRFCAEDRQDSSGSFINEFNIDQKAILKGADFTIQDGLGIITANSSVDRIHFSGSTDPERYPILVSHASVEIHTNFSWVKED